MYVMLATGAAYDKTIYFIRIDNHIVLESNKKDIENLILLKLEKIYPKWFYEEELINTGPYVIGWFIDSSLEINTESNRLPGIWKELYDFINPSDFGICQASRREDPKDIQEKPFLKQVTDLNNILKIVQLLFSKWEDKDKLHPRIYNYMSAVCAGTSDCHILRYDILPWLKTKLFRIES